MKTNFLYSGSRGDDTMTIMTVIVSSVSESVSDVCWADGGGGSVVGLMGTCQHLAYLHHTLAYLPYTKKYFTLLSLVLG